jgi:hypothetical protein
MQAIKAQRSALPAIQQQRSPAVMQQKLGFRSQVRLPSKTWELSFCLASLWCFLSSVLRSAGGRRCCGTSPGEPARHCGPAHWHGR